jgi:hypothetical protein
VKLADIVRYVKYTVKMPLVMDLVRKWVRKFNEGRDNVRDDPPSGRPSVVSDDFVRAAEAKVREDRQFTISSLSLHFQQISRNLLCETVTHRLDFRELCSRWVPKMLSEEHKKKRAASAFAFLTRYSEQGDGRLSEIVTDDETWVSHLIRNRSNNLWSGGTPRRRKSTNSSRPFQPARSCLQFFVIGKEYCLLNSCLKAQP